ncbi:MAG TPA: metallophosphoesterase [Verrucomicrobiae bacterium]|nr:metallophosphoesterase [Verrucomicrobiae bacterium]
MALQPMHVRAGDFEFVVIGDTRPRFESESFKPFESLISMINAAKPALVVNLGDLIYGYGLPKKDKQWDKYESVVKAVRAPYYQVPGNHDTHSKEARRIYGRRFGKFYQSFDHKDCHFVLMDNTEDQRWGYVSPAQLNWLKEDLRGTRARAIFVFMHFPMWEPERITPESYQLWEQTLHPLFKSSRVRAVFGGHYHTYGPTREFDGIRYFITGGGGAELRPEYKKSGGEYHFMKVNVVGEGFDIRVVTKDGELTDPEADMMGGLQFAARNVSRIGIKGEGESLRSGLSFRVSVMNPYRERLRGEANWLADTTAFVVEPKRVAIDIPAGGTHDFRFFLKPLRETTTLASLPQLQFDVASAGRQYRFHREVRFIHQTPTPYRTTAPMVDGSVSDWEQVPGIKLEDRAQLRTELRSCYDARMLYLLFCIPTFETAEAKELGFSDELQIGISRPVSETEFGADLLRLGFNAAVTEAKDRTPGHKPGAAIRGTKSVASQINGQTCYEIAIPWGLVDISKPRPGNRVMLDLSFLAPETESDDGDGSEPAPNTLSYCVRYGNDSLVPVHFLELNLEANR